MQFRDKVRNMRPSSKILLGSMIVEILSLTLPGIWVFVIGWTLGSMGVGFGLKTRAIEDLRNG
jgi:hypothetical protein